ncbi:hypothetical protein Plhal304r1_c003g0012451 [Plasmopara halstedii]
MVWDTWTRQGDRSSLRYFLNSCGEIFGNKQQDMMNVFVGLLPQFQILKRIEN